jgi:hypothetical protein
MIDIRDERIYETYKDKNSVLDGDWVSLKSSDLSTILQNDIIRIKITDTLTSKKLLDQRIIIEKIKKNGSKLKISIDDDDDDDGINNINTLYLTYTDDLYKEVAFGLQNLPYRLATFKMSKCKFNTLCKCKTCFVTIWKKINVPTTNKKNKLKDIPDYMLKPNMLNKEQNNKQRNTILSNDPFLNELQSILKEKKLTTTQSKRRTRKSNDPLLTKLQGLQKKHSISVLPETRRKSISNNRRKSVNIEQKIIPKMNKVKGVSNSTKKINNALIQELATLQKNNK